MKWYLVLFPVECKRGMLQKGEIVSEDDFHGQDGEELAAVGKLTTITEKEAKKKMAELEESKKPKDQEPKEGSVLGKVKEAFAG